MRNWSNFRDGYSGMIVSSSVMPKKYKRAISEHGLWQQIRVDHGREFKSAAAW